MDTADPKTLAIQRAGGIVELARALGLTRQAVYKWTRVPIEHVLTIERLTRVRRHELRPDIYPAPRRRKPAA